MFNQILTAGKSTGPLFSLSLVNCKDNKDMYYIWG